MPEIQVPMPARGKPEHRQELPQLGRVLRDAGDVPHGPALLALAHEAKAGKS